METRHRPDPASGFTLIELLVTLTIASILLVVAVPGFRSVAVNNRLTTQANDLVVAINLARSEAIKRNSTITFCRAASDSATACSNATGTWEHWIIVNPAATVLRRGSINSYGGTVVVKSELTNDAATFGSDGLTRTGGALATDDPITICSTQVVEGNLREVVMGGGSRLFTRVGKKTSC